MGGGQPGLFQVPDLPRSLFHHHRGVHSRPMTSRAHGVVVSHPLRMRKALGSIPSVSISFVPHTYILKAGIVFFLRTSLRYICHDCCSRGV